MAAADRIQLFPHAFVYTILAATAAWLVLVVGVALRALWRAWPTQRQPVWAAERGAHGRRLPHTFSDTDAADQRSAG